MCGGARGESLAVQRTGCPLRAYDLPVARSPSLTLSKSRFCYGLQCLKQLWWRVHEPDAPELLPDPSLRAVFDRGHQVGARARADFPGGTLIGHEYWEVEQKVADTQAALDAKAPAIFEAAFTADDVYVAVDILERRWNGHALVEVKSSNSVKEQYLPDVAIQLHVLRSSGLDVPVADVMHLNPACRYPDLSNLFVREDVTVEAEALLPQIPAQLARMKEAIAGDLPAVEIGPHCREPYDCPFMARCWPRLPEHHVSTLHNGGRLAQRLAAQGVALIRDIPDETPLSAPQRRQVRAVRTGRVVVEPGLAEALAVLEPPIAFLDFETVGPAIPAWDGCGPYTQVPVQFSCDVVEEDGSIAHREYLADGPGDPRPGVAAAVVDACAGARTVAAYNARFERGCIEHLADHVPTQSNSLAAVARKLVDLLPIVRENVYHPAFGGSFSMKAVAPALAGLDYSGLAIGEGSTASVTLESLLLGAGDLDASARDGLRQRLLEYCALDTTAMVKVVEALRALADRGPDPE